MPIGSYLRHTARSKGLISRVSSAISADKVPGSARCVGTYDLASANTTGGGWGWAIALKMVYMPMILDRRIQDEIYASDITTILYTYNQLSYIPGVSRHVPFVDICPSDPALLKILDVSIRPRQLYFMRYVGIEVLLLPVRPDCHPSRSYACNICGPISDNNDENQVIQSSEFNAALCKGIFRLISMPLGSLASYRFQTMNHVCRKRSRRAIPSPSKISHYLNISGFSGLVEICC